MKANWSPGRFAALAIAVAALTGLAACGRESKVLSPPVSGPVTWTNTISHLLADRSVGTKPTGCTSCHHAGTGIPDWSDYDTVVANAATIKTRLSNPGDTMYGFLNPPEQQTVIDWIDAGTPK